MSNQTTVDLLLLRVEELEAENEDLKKKMKDMEQTIYILRSQVLLNKDLLAGYSYY